MSDSVKMLHATRSMRAGLEKETLSSSQDERAPSGTVGCERCVFVDQGAPRLSNPATG